MGTGIWISCTLPVSWNSIPLWFFFKSLTNLKTFLSSWALNTQVAEWIWPMGRSLLISALKHEMVVRRREWYAGLKALCWCWSPRCLKRLWKCLSSGCYKIPLTRCLKQQTFKSWSSGGWEVQDRIVHRFCIWWELTSWFTESHLFVCLHMMEEALSSSSLIRHHFHHGAPPSCPHPNLNTSQRPHLQYHHTGDWLSTFKFWGEINIQYIAKS